MGRGCGGRGVGGLWGETNLIADGFRLGGVIQLEKMIERYRTIPDRHKLRRQPFNCLI